MLNKECWWAWITLLKKQVYEIIWMGGDLREWYSPVMFHRKGRGIVKRERVKERGGKAFSPRSWSFCLWSHSPHFNMLLSSRPLLTTGLFHRASGSKMCVPDICRCWKPSLISPALPRVPLLVNTPAVRTKWTPRLWDVQPVRREKRADVSTTSPPDPALKKRGPIPLQPFFD